MNLPPTPHPNSAAIRAIERDLIVMTAGDTTWSAFLRGYMKHAARRLAWNCRLVEQSLSHSEVWLDLGSFGIEALWLKQKRPEAQVHCVSYEGMDLHVGPNGVDSGLGQPSTNPSISIARADVERESLPMPDASCDLVTCFECIEHLRTTPRRMLNEIRRVIKPGGRLLLTTPNVVGSRAMIRLLAGKNPQENPRYHRDENYGIVHPKEYTMRELTQLLLSRSLRPVRESSLYFRPVTLVDRFASLLAMMTRPIGGRLLKIGGQPVLMGDNLFVVAEPHDGSEEEWPALVFEPAP